MTTSSLHLRRDAAQATIDAFTGKPLVWGKTDCGRLAAHALRGLGHKPNLIRGGFYRNALGAKRALLRAGFRRLAEAIDAMGFLRIPPAAALCCDIIALPAPDDWDALYVAVGNGRALGFIEQSGRCEVAQPRFDRCPADRPAIAWRCDPCPPR